MADKKITELGEVTDVAADDLLPVVAGSVTSKISVKDFVGKGIERLDDNTISNTKITYTDNSIPGAALKDGEVDTDQIKDDAITGALIDDNVICKIFNKEDPNEFEAGDYKGQLAQSVESKSLYVYDGTGFWAPVKATESINEIKGDEKGLIHISPNTVDGVTTIKAALINSKNAAEFLAGPPDRSGGASYRNITPADLPIATTSTRGTVVIDANQAGGLSVNDEGVLKVQNKIANFQANSNFVLVTFDEHGLVTGGRAVSPDDIPVATNSTLGAAMAGTGLNAGADGAFNHVNSNKQGTFFKVIVDNEGHVTGGDKTLSGDDIPNIDASKITTGDITHNVIGKGEVYGDNLHDNATVQFVGLSDSDKTVALPDAEFIGQLVYDSANNELYIAMSQGANHYESITTLKGGVVNAGTFDASTGNMVTVTDAGTAAGYTAGANLPEPAERNRNTFVVVVKAGNPGGAGGAPNVTVTPPDQLISTGKTGTKFQIIDVSASFSAPVASAIGINNVGNLTGNSVQSAMQNIDNVKANKKQPNFTGIVGIGPTTDQSVVNPKIVFTVNKSTNILPNAGITDNIDVTLPETSGTLITKNEVDSVTKAMMSTGSVGNDEIEANANIALNKIIGSPNQNYHLRASVSETPAGGGPTTYRLSYHRDLDTTGGVNAALLSTFNGGVVVDSSDLVLKNANSDLKYVRPFTDPDDGTTVNREVKFVLPALFKDAAFPPSYDLTLPFGTTDICGTAVAQTYTKAQRGQPFEVNTPANQVTLNFIEANNFHITITQTCLLKKPDGLVAGQSGVIRVKQDSVGGHELSFDSEFKFPGGFPPSASILANQIDLYAYYVDSTDPAQIFMVSSLDLTRGN